MDNEIKKYVQSCPICQLQKTTRIKKQAKSILPDIPLAPNEKLGLDIFGPLPETQKGNRYILSMQDRLTTQITKCAYSASVTARTGADYASRVRSRRHADASSYATHIAGT